MKIILMILAIMFVCSTIAGLVLVMLDERSTNNVK